MQTEEYETQSPGVWTRPTLCIGIYNGRYSNVAWASDRDWKDTLMKVLRRLLGINGCARGQLHLLWHKSCTFNFLRCPFFLPCFSPSSATLFTSPLRFSLPHCTFHFPTALFTSPPHFSFFLLHFSFSLLRFTWLFCLPPFLEYEKQWMCIWKYYMVITTLQSTPW